MKLNTLLLVSAAAIIVAGGSGYWYFNRNTDEVKWRTAIVERGEVRKRVSATGTLFAMNQVNVGTQVSGKVMSLNADYNSIVKKGQLIATIDDLLYSQRMREAEISLENAKVTLKDAEIQHKRSKTLHDNKLISDADLERAEISLRNATASYERAEISLEQRKADLDYCNIYAPMDGIVIQRRSDVGETVQASMQVPTLFQIAEDLGTMKLEINMDEADMAEIDVGQVANFTVDSVGSDTPFHGVVAQVRLDSTSQQNVVNYKVVVEVKNRTKKEIEEEKELARERRLAMLSAMESGQMPGQGERGERGDRGERSERSSSDTAQAPVTPSGSSPRGESQDRPSEGRNQTPRTPQAPQAGGPERRPGGQGGFASMIITTEDGQPNFDATWEARKARILENEPNITKEAWIERTKQMMAQRGQRQGPDGFGGQGGTPVFRSRTPQATPLQGGQAPQSAIIKSGGEFYQGEYLLRPGMTANVTIITREKSDILRVPNVALRFTASQYVKDYVPPTGPGNPFGAGQGQPGQGQAGPRPQMMPGQQRNMQVARRERIADRGLVAMRDDRIWVLDDKGKVKSIPVVVGLTDIQYSEISGIGLTDNMEILIGVEEGKKNKSQGPSSPFGGGMRIGR